MISSKSILPSSAFFKCLLHVDGLSAINLQQNWQTRLFLGIEKDLTLMYQPELVGKDSWPDDWSDQPIPLENYTKHYCYTCQY